MGIKVVPRKKKATLTPLQQRVMRGYKHGGLVKGSTYRENTPSGVKVRKGKVENRVNTPGGVKQRRPTGAIGSAVGAAAAGRNPLAGNIGNLLQQKRFKTNSNRRK